jgi:hypothetical protein|tara:strand:+ start:2313 stop:2666 length:354 start_codon:yes stop_codon:yes gene_type:complete
METQTYNEHFNTLWEKSNESNHSHVNERRIIGEFIVEMMDKKLMVYIGEGHPYGVPFSRIPVSHDGENEYVMIKPRLSDVPIKYRVITDEYNNQRYIEWTSWAAEQDFYDGNRKDLD